MAVLNQYTSAGPASFTYDANGNLTSDGTSAFVYDAENRLIAVTQGATSFTVGSEVKLTAGQVDWSAAGPEPAPGSTSDVTYTYVHLVAPTAPDAKGGTVMTYVYDAAIGGKVASIGGRLLDGATKVIIGKFFEALAKQAGGGSSPSLFGKVKSLFGGRS